MSDPTSTTPLHDACHPTLKPRDLCGYLVKLQYQQRHPRVCATLMGRLYGMPTGQFAVGDHTNGTEFNPEWAVVLAHEPGDTPVIDIIA